MPVPLNPDLPSNWLIPGIYLSLDLRGSSASLGSLAKRILLVGHKTSSGITALNSVSKLLGQSDANLQFGRGSDLARLHAAVLSQIGGGAADIYGVAAPEPVGGTASTHLITFVGNAAATDEVDVTICGYDVTVAIGNTDTAVEIAANVAAAVNSQLLDVPVTATANGPTVTLTYRHEGLVGNDLPVMVAFSGSSGVRASPGAITFAGTASGAGSATLDIGATSVLISIADGSTASNLPAAFAQAFAADSYPCTAEDSGNGVLTLYYVPGRVVHRMAGNVFGSTGITLTPAFGALGVGVPTLTNALGRVAGQAAFPCWVTSLIDAQPLSAMAAHIEANSDGKRQKDQELFVASTSPLGAANAIALATTPALSSSPRYAVGWCPDAPVQAAELAARMAARVTVEDYYPYNYDGEPLKSDGTVPLLLPHVDVRPDEDDQNAALQAGLTPLAVDESLGQLVIVSDRTTMQSTDTRLWAWGTIRTLGFYRADLAAFLKLRFPHKNLKLYGNSYTQNTVKLSSIKDAVLERIRTWDNNDLFDGVDDLAPQVMVQANATNRSRVDIFVPCRPPAKLDQLSGVAALV